MKARSVLALNALLMALSSQASAAKPDSFPEPPADVVFPAGVACPAFPVHLTTEARGKVKVFSNGEIQATGYESVSLTNLSTGAQVELNVNGRTRIIPGQDGGPGLLLITGPQLVIFFPGDAGPGDLTESRTYYFKGKARAAIDENFVFLDFWFSGNSTDICAELA